MLLTGQRRLNESSCYSIVNCLTGTINISDFGGDKNVVTGFPGRNNQENDGNNRTKSVQYAKNLPKYANFA